MADNEVKKPKRSGADAYYEVSVNDVKKTYQNNKHSAKT